MEIDIVPGLRLHRDCTEREWDRRWAYRRRQAPGRCTLECGDAARSRPSDHRRPHRRRREARPCRIREWIRAFEESPFPRSKRRDKKKKMREGFVM